MHCIQEFHLEFTQTIICNLSRGDWTNFLKLIAELQRYLFCLIAVLFRTNSPFTCTSLSFRKLSLCRSTRNTRFRSTSTNRTPFAFCSLNNAYRLEYQGSNLDYKNQSLVWLPLHHIPIIVPFNELEPSRYSAINFHFLPYRYGKQSLMTANVRNKNDTYKIFGYFFFLTNPFLSESVLQPP